MVLNDYHFNRLRIVLRKALCYYRGRKSKLKRMPLFLSLSFSTLFPCDINPNLHAHDIISFTIRWRDQQTISAILHGVWIERDIFIFCVRFENSTKCFKMSFDSDGPLGICFLLREIQFSCLFRDVSYLKEMYKFHLSCTKM